MSDRVYWYEEHAENSKIVDRLVREDIRAFDQRSLAAVKGDMKRLAAKIIEKHEESHPTSVKVFARIVSVGFQPAMIAGANGTMRAVFERIPSGWKLLVRREDNGTLIEKLITEVTCDSMNTAVQP